MTMKKKGAETKEGEKYENGVSIPPKRKKVSAGSSPHLPEITPPP